MTKSTPQQRFLAKLKEATDAEGLSESVASDIEFETPTCQPHSHSHPHPPSLSAQSTRSRPIISGLSSSNEAATDDDSTIVDGRGAHEYDTESSESEGGTPEAGVLKTAEEYDADDELDVYLYLTEGEVDD